MALCLLTVNDQIDDLTGEHEIMEQYATETGGLFRYLSLKQVFRSVAVLGHHMRDLSTHFPSLGVAMQYCARPLS